MKYLIIFLLFLLASCNKDLPKNGQIEIVPTYCKYKNQVNYLTQKIRLYKKSENIVEIKLNDNNKKPGTNNFIVSDLEYGNYYIEYTTIYNQKNIVEFKVNQSNLKTVDICLDYIDYEANKNVLLIDELQNGETIILDFFHQGCFDTFEHSKILSLTKNNGKIEVEFNQQKYLLSDSQIKIFREFEIELRCNHKDGSSSIDKYVILNRKTYESFKCEDGSSQWRGFDNLIKSLNLK